MKRPEIEMVVSLGGPATIKGPVDEPGYGDDGDEFAGQEVCIVGKVANIRVSLNDETQFGIYLRCDGSLSITHYAGCFHMDAPRNLELRADRPWPEQEPTDDD